MLREDTKMKEKIPNTAIRCTVEDCKYHCISNFCGLDSIDVGAHEEEPKKCESVDCTSFARADGAW